MKIPVRNIYYLLIHAWDHIGEGETIDVDSEEFNGPIDLFAKVLNEGISRLISSGLDRDYLDKSEDIRGIKGKLDLGSSIKRNLMMSGKTHCTFDEMSYDVLHNQILKATLRSLTMIPTLNPIEKRRTERLYRKLDAVSDVQLTANLFLSVRIHRNNRFYSLLLHICRIILENLLVTEQEGTKEFRDFREDDHQMGLLFEQFVKSFCKRKTNYQVSAPVFDWLGAKESGSGIDFLPRMETDIVLRSTERTIIIDTKFYKEPLTSSQYGTRKIRPNHLYQVFAYVNNLVTESETHAPEAWLLYASVDGDFDLKYTLAGRPIRVCSIDLSQHWSQIERDLRELLEVTKTETGPVRRQTHSPVTFAESLHL